MKRTLYIILCLLFTASAFATTYTVKTADGDYSNPITCANAVSAGDICDVYNGSYSGGTITNSGSAGGGFITIKAASGQTPSLSSGINVGNEDYISIEGLYINGYVRNTSSQDATNIKIKNCTIDGDGSDLISLNAYNVLIDNVIFDDLNSQDAIRQFGKYWIIRDSEVINESDTLDEHLDFWQTGCWGGDGASYVLFENNEFRGIDGSNNVHLFLANITDSCNHVAEYMILRYNKSWDVGQAGGTYTGAWCDPNQQEPGAGNWALYNNTWGDQVMVSTYDIVGRLDAGSNNDNVNDLYDNAMYRVGLRGYNIGSSGRQEHNLYYDPDGSVSLEYAQPNSILNSDPLLTDPDNGDYSIPSNSPAIDMGGPLTRASGSGSSSTTLVVDDASFFQDGSWISDSEVQADTIYIRSVARPDILLDFEDGNDGDGITPTTLNSNMIGSGCTWSYQEGGERLDVDTGLVKQTDYPTYVDQSWYDDSSGTRSALFPDNSTSSSLYQCYHATGDLTVSMGSFIRLHTVPSGYYGDVMMIVSGTQNGEDGYCVAQTRDSGSGDFIQSHTWVSGSGTRYGSGVYYEDDKWYWLAVNWNGNTGVCTVGLWDIDDWSLVGTSSVSGELNGRTAEKESFGNDPHGQSLSDDHSYDNLMIDYSGRWPFLPTLSVQTVQISSINYSTNTITLSQAVSWNDNDEIGLYADSDGTVVYYGLAPDIGAYEYSGTDTTAPTISGSPTIENDGQTVVVNFSEVVITTGYDNGDFNLDCTTAGTDISLNSISGTGASRSFTAATTIYENDTCNLDTGAGYSADEIEDEAGNDLATVTDRAVINNSTQDATAPTVISTSIEADGETVTITFSETVVTTGYDNGDFDIDCTTAGSNIALNSISGTGSARSFTLASTVNGSDSCDLDYTGGADEIEDTEGNDLVTFEGGTVYNNSGLGVVTNTGSGLSLSGGGM